METTEFMRKHENWRELLSNAPYFISFDEDDNYVLLKYETTVKLLLGLIAIMQIQYLITENFCLTLSKQGWSRRWKNEFMG